MHAAGHSFNVLSPAEEDILHRNILRLVDEVGLQVESDALLDRVQASGLGARIDRTRRRMMLPPAAAEAFIASSEPVRWEERPPRVNGGVEVYYGHYLDPVTDEYAPMTVERARRYFRVAHALPHVNNTSMLGCPLNDVPRAAEPLYERYWSWSLGVRPGGSIHQVRWAPYILEMYDVHAAATGQSPEEVFSAGVYLVPPFKLGYQEAEQVLWFLERGRRVHIGGSMPTGGATAPVTLAGMVALTAAEGLLLGALNRALFGDRTWGIWMSVTAMDPRTAMRPYGRPDMALANLMGLQLARRYRCDGGGHSGLTDSPRPSPAAAAQKLQSALSTLLARGRVGVPMGLLAVDEVFSPVQIALDDEMVSALEQFTREYEISDESIAADMVAAVGPGGNFAAEEHTARWFRRELWEPVLWERHHFSAWRERDGRTDLDRAREQVLAILAQPAPPSAISEREERDLQQIIRRAMGRS